MSVGFDHDCNDRARMIRVAIKYPDVKLSFTPSPLDGVRQVECWSVAHAKNCCRTRVSFIHCAN
jgi:hypothetical protein